MITIDHAFMQSYRRMDTYIDVRDDHIYMTSSNFHILMFLLMMSRSFLFCVSPNVFFILSLLIVSVIRGEKTSACLSLISLVLELDRNRQEKEKKVYY